MAASTGIRRAELEALTWNDVALDAPIPYVLVRASTSKNKKSKALPLHADTISALQELRSAESAASDLVFEGRHFPRMWRFKSDLRAAGIEYIDACGRRADFHALRHTFATYLNAQGVSPCAAMELMRHSEMRLTTKVYTDTNLLGLAEASTESALGWKPTADLLHIIARQVVARPARPSQKQTRETRGTSGLQREGRRTWYRPRTFATQRVPGWAAHWPL